MIVEQGHRLLAGGAGVVFDDHHLAAAAGGGDVEEVGAGPKEVLAWVVEPGA